MGDDFIFITGYHGTTSVKNAESIIKNGFNISKTKKNWLGDGIYFYPSFEDAYNWKNIETGAQSKAILHSVIKINKREFIDLDTAEGKKLLSLLIKELKKSTNISDKHNIQERQCAAMKYLWQIYKKVNVIACEFAPEESPIKLLTDYRKKRKEFCVRDNKYIIHTMLIKRSDVDV